MATVEDPRSDLLNGDAGAPRSFSDFVQAFGNARGSGSSTANVDRLAEYGPVRPYPGLRSFDDGEHALFYGRDTEISEVRERLAENGIVFVLGGSGSGKSSLILAGLLPKVRAEGSLGDRTGRWYIVQFRPLKSPRRQLMEAVKRQVLDHIGEHPERREALATVFGLERDDSKQAIFERFNELVFPETGPDQSRQLSAQGLFGFASLVLDEADAIASPLRAGASNLLLVIDQFEEIFSNQVDPAQQREIIDLICQIHKQRPPGFYLAVTMRSEALNRCSEWPGLSDVVNDSLYLLELLDLKESARNAIIEPAEAVRQNWRLTSKAPIGHFIEEKLVDHLLEMSEQLRCTAQNRPDHLPLLQHALQATWDEAASRWIKEDKESQCAEIDHRVLLKDFAAILPIRKDRSNNLAKCLNTMADRAYEEAVEQYRSKCRDAGDRSRKLPLKASAEDLIRVAFCELADTDDRGNPVRRFATPSGIVDFIGDSPSTSKAAKDCLEQSLDVFVRRGFLNKSDGQYNVAHEALIRCWERYHNDWLRTAHEAIDGVLSAAKKAKETEGADRLIGAYPSLIENPRAWLQTRREWWVAAREEKAREILNGRTIENLKLIFGEDSKFTRNWAVRILTRNLEVTRKANFSEQMPAGPREAEAVEDAEECISQIETAIPLANAWEGAQRRKRVMSWAPFPLVIVIAVITSVASELLRQHRLLQAHAVANAAVGEERLPENSVHEISASIDHWKMNNQPWFYEAPANFLLEGSSERTTAEIARQTIETAARRLFGENILAEFNRGHDFTSSVRLNCGFDADSMKQQINPWSDDLNRIFSGNTDNIYCFGVGGNSVLSWSQDSPLPAVFKLYWYCDIKSDGYCPESEWRVFFSKPATILGYDPTDTEEKEAVIKIREYLYTATEGVDPKQTGNILGIGGSYVDESGFLFDDGNGNSMQLTMNFGFIDPAPVETVPNDATFSKCTTSERIITCDLGGTEQLTYQMANRTITLSIDKDNFYYPWRHLSGTKLRSATIHDGFVWFEDEYNKIWRLVYDLDEIEKDIDARHVRISSNLDHDWQSKICQKFECKDWLQ